TDKPACSATARPHPCDRQQEAQSQFHFHAFEEATAMVNTTIQPERTEGPVAKTIERETSKVPSDWFLWGALAAVGTSFALQLMDRRERSLFVGQWVPTLLLLGVHNKIVKVA